MESLGGIEIFLRLNRFRGSAFETKQVREVDNETGRGSRFPFNEGEIFLRFLSMDADSKKRFFQFSYFPGKFPRKSIPRLLISDERLIG